MKTLARPKNTTTPGNFGSPLRIIASLIFIFLASQFIGALIAETLLALTGGYNDINYSAAGQFVFMLLAEGLAVALVLWILRRRGLKLAAIGLGRWPRWGDLGRGLLGLGAFYLILGFILILISKFVPVVNLNQAQDLGFNHINSSLDHLLAFMALVFLPPLGEEILVRGYLFSGLRSHWKFVPAAIVTSLLFAAGHLQAGSGAPLVWGAALDTFVLSLVLVYLREHSGALYAGMLVHMVNNLVAFGVHFK